MSFLLARKSLPTKKAKYLPVLKLQSSPLMSEACLGLLLWDEFINAHRSHVFAKPRSSSCLSSHIVILRRTGAVTRRR